MDVGGAQLKDLSMTQIFGPSLLATFTLNQFVS
jgi:hypothetical protein